MCVEGERKRGGGREIRSRKGDKEEEGRNTCTILRWRMAQLLMAFMAAVAMVRVEVWEGEGRGRVARRTIM